MVIPLSPNGLDVSLPEPRSGRTAWPTTLARNKRHNWTQILLVVSAGKATGVTNSHDNLESEKILRKVETPVSANFYWCMTWNPTAVLQPTTPSAVRTFTA